MDVLVTKIVSAAFIYLRYELEALRTRQGEQKCCSYLKSRRLVTAVGRHSLVPSTRLDRRILHLLSDFDAFSDKMQRYVAEALIFGCSRHEIRIPRTISFLKHIFYAHKRCIPSQNHSCFSIRRLLCHTCLSKCMC